MMPAKRSAKSTSAPKRSPKRPRSPKQSYARYAPPLQAALQIVALPFILLLLLAIVWIALNVPLLNQYRVTQIERDKQRNSVRQLEEEVAELEKTESRFEDGLAVEQVLRKTYRMVKPGKNGQPSERLIQIKYDNELTEK